LKVSPRKFEEFALKHQHLRIDICRIPNPPIASYIDTRLDGKWPDTSVGKVVKFSMVNDGPDIYYLRVFSKDFKDLSDWLRKKSEEGPHSMMSMAESAWCGHDYREAWDHVQDMVIEKLISGTILTG